MTKHKLHYTILISAFLLFILIAGCEKKSPPEANPKGTPDTVEPVPPPTDEIKELKETKGYTVVLESVSAGASFSPLADKLKGSGIELYSMKAVVNSEERVRLCAGLFITPSGATEMKARLKNEFGISEAWTLKLEDAELQTDPGIPTDPNTLIDLINNGKVKVVFHATFTEPFLNIFLTDKEFLLTGMGEKSTALLKTKFDPAKKSQTVTFVYAAGNMGSLGIENKPGTDGMSDTKYAYTVYFEPHYGGGSREMRYPPRIE